MYRAGQDNVWVSDTPPIVSLAKDQTKACAYANTLADQKGTSKVDLGSTRHYGEFEISNILSVTAQNGEKGIRIHNTYTPTNETYITFVVGDWESMQSKLGVILGRFRDSYQKIFASKPALPSIQTQSETLPKEMLIIGRTSQEGMVPPERRIPFFREVDCTVYFDPGEPKTGQCGRKGNWPKDATLLGGRFNCVLVDPEVLKFFSRNDEVDKLIQEIFPAQVSLGTPEDPENKKEACNFRGKRFAMAWELQEHLLKLYSEKDPEVVERFNEIDKKYRIPANKLGADLMMDALNAAWKKVCQGGTLWLPLDCGVCTETKSGIDGFKELVSKLPGVLPASIKTVVKCSPCPAGNKCISGLSANAELVEWLKVLKNPENLGRRRQG